jgi:hypothetical protein
MEKIRPANGDYQQAFCQKTPEFQILGTFGVLCFLWECPLVVKTGALP